MRVRAAAALAALLAAAAAAAAPATPDSASDETVESHSLPGGGARELVYRRGALAEERVTDSLGALLEEILYGAAPPAEASPGSPSKDAAESAPLESRKYLRSKSGRLERVEARDSGGELVGSLDYRYDRSGRLLGVASTGSFGPGGAGMISAGGPPRGSWIAAGSSTTASSFDELGRPLVLKTMLDGKAVLVERRTYGAGPNPARIETEDLESGALTAIDDDESGRPILRKDSIRGKETSRTAYRYDEGGRLVEETSRDAAGGLLSRSLSYGEDGALRREETRKDGTLMSAVEYVEGGRVEELYRGGELFVKATYADGRKVRDEFYSEGESVRRKDYK
jgi:YD repeat-containing protein